MATASERLAASLDELKTLQDAGKLALRSEDISRTHRERLIANGFLREVVRGWFIIARPDVGPGDTTFWYSNFWEFCAEFLEERYHDNWCVATEQSIHLHAGNWTVPQQLLVRSPDANNFKTDLLFDTSIFSLRSELPINRETTELNGIRLLTIPAALIHCASSTYTQHVTDIRTVLSLVSDSSALLELILEGGHSIVAGRLAGAFRNNGQARIADDILKTMESVGYDIRETDPFTDKLQIQLNQRERSPYVNKIKLMWAGMRNTIIDVFPKAPGIPVDRTVYLKQVEDIYKTDAYHSLSIEKYKVTPELIEKVRSGAWDHRESEADKNERDAMAARGYWQAFQMVKESIEKILDGANPGMIADNEHGDWYRELFAPSVSVGLLKPGDLAGYRNHQVYLFGSKHVPLNKEAVRDAMPALFEELIREPEASVRAVLGHFIFVYIHPYMDGNGRMGRFLMNTMLASGGYPWTVIPVEERDNYMQALESASAGQDIKPFATFMAYLVNQSLKGLPVATLKNR